MLDKILQFILTKFAYYEISVSENIPQLQIQTTVYSVTTVTSVGLT